MTTDCCALIESSSGFSVCLSIERPEIMAIGQKMEEICPEAYMNGYNWEALLRYYLEQNAPEVLEEMEADPEAGTYVAYYPLAKENEARAEKLFKIIGGLVEREEELCRLVREHGDEIEWD